MKKIYITRRIPAAGLSLLRKQGYAVDVWPRDTAPSKGDIIKALKKGAYDGAITLLTDTIDAEVMDAAPTVRIFANYADGFNNIDLAEAKKRGIAVTNTPGVSSQAVAEHAVALMLALATRLVEADAFTRRGKYRGWAPMNLIGTDLGGKTLGLVGAGHIGAHAARIMKNGFGARVVYYDVAENASIEKECGAQRKLSLEELLREADFVSIHVPLLPSTHHLIDETRLGMMKPTAFLVNTSRGPVIDENALVKALQAGKIAGAGLDVYEFEPKLTRGLAKLPNVVLTPHIASARDSVRNAMAVLAAQNVIDCLEGREPQNRVA